jgi:hypothetical protein
MSEPATFAPIALFTYRRPSHLARALHALRANPEAAKTELFVFSDNARSPAETLDVNAVSQLLQGINGFAGTHIRYRERNFGLANNIIDGVTAVLAKRSAVIVVEDDIVVSPHFLQFMNEALQFYKDVPRVGSISGYCYPIVARVPETYFIRGSDCWGWATWHDRWQYFNPDSRSLVAELESRNLWHPFDLEGAAPFSQMLKDHLAGKNDSWAIRWHASCYLRDLLILYPGRSLAQNIGFDGSGTHCKDVDHTLDVALSPTPVVIGKVPIEGNTEAREGIKRVFQGQHAAKTAKPDDRSVPPPHRGLALQRWVRHFMPGPALNLLRRLRAVTR